MDIQGMWDLFFDHPSDDDDEDYFPPQREFHPKIPDFFENIVSTYSLTDFKSHFRLEKTTYERLVQTLGGRLHRDRGAEKMSPDKQIAITLWVLGNQEVYRLPATNSRNSQLATRPWIWLYRTPLSCHES
ncbi:uncharacterized protein [Temnothorax nylanderi]|uniref:uncharacterized protein isoform X2 n=1 Tax=Temnothorax nylanderi TaxID=102681 RepID=UPI003A84227E